MYGTVAPGDIRKYYREQVGAGLRSDAGLAQAGEIVGCRAHCLSGCAMMAWCGVTIIDSDLILRIVKKGIEVYQKD